MVNKDLRKKFAAKNVYRGTQMILGERQHLGEVLRSVRKAKIPTRRKLAEKRALETMIRVRTDELNRINPGWDKKFRQAGNPKTTPKELLRLAASLPKDDYLLARLLTEHANAPGELLQRLARHPYPAVRENVARHPHTPPELLLKLAEEKSEPLWFLVACNPSTPQDLRDRLRARMAASAPTAS
ncbi:MAG TPA: hypothetical protein VG028_14600 [Terriglobia bacterium]|nr:hypothetical protein [Terriglobia bacterium]